jgi:hypothetical protein
MNAGIRTPAILRKRQDQRLQMRVALVTEELSYGPGSGGIGGAFHELSLVLARAGRQSVFMSCRTSAHMSAV